MVVTFPCLKGHLDDVYVFQLRKTNNVGETAYLEQCETALVWARHMMTFRHLLPAADLDLSATLFSLVIELEPGEQAAKLLAEHFHRQEALPPEIDDKLQWLLNDWKRYEVSGKTERMTLSRYYEKTAAKYDGLLEKRRRVFGAYDEFVFLDSAVDHERDSTLCIGSRSFESEAGYLEFLDEFYAVSFNKLIDQESEQQSPAPTAPLLARYSDA